MAVFVGHGMLENYSRNIVIEGEERLNKIVDLLGIPGYMIEHIIFIKNHSKLGNDELIKNEDEVHFYIVPFGG